MQSTNNDKYIDRPFNIRPFVFWAFFAGITVVVCNFAYRSDNLWLVLVYFVALLLMFSGLQFLQTRTEDKVLQFLGTNRMFFCVTMILCIMVASSYAFTILAHTNQRSYAGFGELDGVVERYRVNSEGGGHILLSNANFDGSPVAGNVIIYVRNVGDTNWITFDTFDRISVTTQLRKANPSDFNINNGIKYTSNIRDTDLITFVGADNSLRSVVLRHTRNFFGMFMSENNANLMYSMLFGDRSSLDGELQQDFRLTGIAHILAVSGLHVGLIVALLVLLCNWFKLNRKRQLFVILTVLIIYCYLCGFAYPIVRSSIMFGVFSIHRIFLRSSDMLSSLGLAAIVTLIIFPTALFTVSFQMSFACMLGIAFFRLPIYNTLAFVRVHWIRESLALYICTTIITLSIMIKYFQMFSLVGLIANVFVVPLIILTFQASIIALATYIAFPLLWMTAPFLDFATAVTAWMAELPLAYISITGGGGDWFLLYMLGLLFFTRHLFMRRNIKWTIGSILIAVYAVSVVLL